jgi:ferredoxin-NADP reductase
VLSYRSVLLVAGGVGITPVMSLLRAIVRSGAAATAAEEGKGGGGSPRCGGPTSGACWPRPSKSPKKREGENRRKELLVDASARRRRHVFLVWAVRRRESLLWFADTLKALQARPARGNVSVRVDLYVTGEGGDEAGEDLEAPVGAGAAAGGGDERAHKTDVCRTDVYPEYAAFRPCLDGAAAEAAQAAGATDEACLFSCGPPSLMHAARRACSRAGRQRGVRFDVHLEEFAF